MPVTFEIVAQGTVEGTSNVKQYNAQGTLSYGLIEWGYLVRVIGETDATKLPSDAEAYIKTVVPKGTANGDDPLCTARSYRVAATNPPSPDIVNVIVGFIFTEVPVSSTVWTIDSDSFAEMEQTDSEYDDDGNVVPIVVDNYYLEWLANTDSPPASGAEPAAYGIVTAPRPRKRWSYSKQIYSKDDAIAFDAATVDYVGYLNSTTYVGITDGVPQGLTCAAGTVLCWDAGASFAPYQGTYIARALLIYKPEGWQPWVRFSNSILGVPDNLWRDGPHGPNGMKRTKAIPRADMNALMALI